MGSVYIYPPNRATLNTTTLATAPKQDTMIASLAQIESDITSLEAKDFATETTLSSIDSKDFATQTTLAALLVELELKADLTETQPVSVASLPLPSGAATESTLSSLLTELQLKADLTETQPVSAASLPLPTGAATESTLSSIDGKDFATETTLSSIDGKDFATETTLSSIDGKDFATETTLSSIDGKVTTCDTGNVVVSSSALPTGAATESTLSSLAAEDFATQTTLAALLTELELKADLSETQPVSAASLPLPTGAATSANQSTAIGHLSNIASDVGSIEESVLTEDDAHGGSPLKGVYLVGVRRDAATSPVSGDGDIHPFCFDENGALKTTGSGSSGGDATAANQTTMIGHLVTIASDTTSIDGKITACDTTDVTVGSSVLPTGAATETTLSSLLTELQLKADLTETQPVSAASLPLPTGAATEATLSSLAAEDFATETTLAALAAEDFATQTTLAAVLTELQLKADLTETQPVSAATLPLPTGAATEATLSTIGADTSSLAGCVSGSEVQVDVISSALPTGAATSAKQDTVISELQRDVVFKHRHDYSSTNVTTSAYVELIASSSVACEEVEVFDSSGETLVIGVGAAASEVEKLYVIPGGNGRIPCRITSSSRIAVKAISDDAAFGELILNFIG